MIIRTLDTDGDYERASGTSLYSWVFQPGALVLAEPPVEAPKLAFLAHCMLVFAAGEESTFAGCQIAIASHFEGETLQALEEDLVRSLLTGWFGRPPESLQCLVTFSKQDFVQARVLLAALCAYQWESQLIAQQGKLICNVSHDGYFAFYGRDPQALEAFRRQLQTEGFSMVSREVAARIARDMA